jgi:sodium-dependent dicarboxylate transporter 2/3/5
MKSMRFASVVALTVLVLLLPTPAGLSAVGKKAMAAFVFTAGIFALLPVPLPFAGLMVPVVLVLLGVASPAQAFENLSRPIIMLILGSLFIAEALRKHGVTRRLALTSIVASGGGVSRLLLGMMVIAGMLSMWMENTATAAVLIPVALTISSQVQDEDRSREILVLLVMGIAYAASIGGMATVTGSASNAVASSFLAEVRPWTFIDWMRYGIPSFLLVFPLTWWALKRLVKVGVERLDISRAREDLRNLGPIRGVEWETIATLNVTILFWVSGSYLEAFLGLPPMTLSPAVVAMTAVAYLALRGIIEWEDVRGVSWGMFFTISAGLSLGEALVRTGATDWMSGLIRPVLLGTPLLFGLLFLVFMSSLLTNVVNNATVAAVFVPILISIAQGDPSFNSVQLVLPLTLATTFGYALPSASGRMALISATGIVERRVMARVGMIVTLVSALVLSMLFYTLIILRLI